MGILTGKTAALHTLGCKVNAYETDAMRAMLEDAGCSITDFDKKADIYVINTCSVTNIADRKSRQMIHKARKMNPGAVVCAAGCYVQTAADKTGLEVDADIILGSSRKGDLVKKLEDYFAQPGHETPLSPDVADVLHDLSIENLSVPRIEGHTRAYIKVQDGCSMFCSYCIIPYARGHVRSKREEDVIRELTALAKEGIREVVLTGIHLSSYGVDFDEDADRAYLEQMEDAGVQLPGAASGPGVRAYADRISQDGGATLRTWQERSKLIDLIEHVAAIEGIERIRLGSLEPTIITRENVLRLSRIRELCPHFHLSLQSGCDTVLRRMNRRYTAEDYLERVELLRKYFDRPAVTTDVIAGFPGESREEFEQTCRFLEKAQLYETHLFKYSLRAGTRAAKMPGQITEKEKARRLDILEEINRANRRRFISSCDGSQAEVLVEEEAQTDERGCLVLPNAQHLDSDAAAAPETGEGEHIYTGYTREYVRAFLISGEDLRGQIVTGKLRVDKIPLLY